MILRSKFISNADIYLFTFSDECGWCKRPVSLGSTEFLASPEGLIYCTESCFTQSRRASFKRAKTCDWCKHIRHAISYVDFQDGATQLQFCSDKCLNQYKMQLFCKETQAHLDMNPHLKEKSSSSTNTLITPDLWLKDCRSRSVSPSNSDNSRSSTSPSQSAQLLRSTSANNQQRPFITVAPASKLISHIEGIPIRIPQHVEPTPHKSDNLSQSTRLMRRRRTRRFHWNAKHGGYRNVNKTNGIGNQKNDGKSADPRKHFNGTFKSDLTPNHQSRTQNNDIEMNRQSAAEKLLHSLNLAPTKANLLQRPQLLPPPPDLFPLNSYQRSQHHSSYGLPHFGPTIQRTSLSGENRSPTIEAIASSFQQSPIFSAFHKAPPPPPPSQQPMTLLVPCPIIVPFPVPIPVPLPFESFLKAAQIKLEAEKSKTYSIHSSKSPNSIMTDTNETSSLDLLNDTDHNLRGGCFVEQPLDLAAVKVIGECHDETTSAHADFDRNNVHSDISIDHESSLKCNSRLHANRSISKESESSRPLRKRKRITESDYQLKSNM